MPELKVLEIWNAAKGHACFFRYSTKDQQSSVTWKRTWDDDLYVWFTAIGHWRNVAQCHTGRDLKVEINSLPLDGGGEELR